MDINGNSFRVYGTNYLRDGACSAQFTDEEEVDHGPQVDRVRLFPVPGVMWLRAQRGGKRYHPKPSLSILP